MRFSNQYGMLRLSLPCLLLCFALVGCRPGSSSHPLTLLRDGTVTKHVDYSEVVLLTYRSIAIKDGLTMGGVSILSRSDQGFYPSFVEPIGKDWPHGRTYLVWMVDAIPSSVEVRGHSVLLKNVTPTSGLWYGWFTGDGIRSVRDVRTEIRDFDAFVQNQNRQRSLRMDRDNSRAPTAPMEP